MLNEQILVGRQPQTNKRDAVAWRIFKISRAVGATRLIGPIFFTDVINSELYIGQIHNFSKVCGEETKYALCLHGGGTTHAVSNWGAPLTKHFWGQTN